jgi:hypothetical protein
MPFVRANDAYFVVRHTVEKPLRRSSVLLSLAIATAFATQPVLADSLLADGDASKPRKTTDEVIVVGNKDAAATEMNRDTEVLLSVPGAANDPLQAIYALPGVTFSTGDGPGGTEPVIRGSAPQDNAYFIDLIPASYLFHLFGNSIFDKNIISSFDLYPAAFSSKYGNATGGIIDVTLRKPKNQDFTTTLHTSFLSAGAMVETGIGDNQSLYATFRRSTMDLLIDADDIGDDEDEGFKIDKLPISSDYQLKYNWQVNDSNSLSFVAAGAADSLAVTFDKTNQEALRDPDFAGPASLKKGFDSQGVVWNWLGSGRELTGIFSHIGSRDSLIYGKAQHEKTDSDRYLSRLFYKQELGDSHTLSTGLSLEDIKYKLDFNAKLVACNDLDPECSTVDASYVVYKETLDVLAHEVYVEDKWSITNKQALTLGVNYNSDDYLSDGRIEPRARYDYQINDKLSSYVSAGQYSQLPQLREMIDVLGNPNLSTVKSDHFVWGISQTLGSGWKWNTDVYYKNMTDIVISAEQDSTAKNYSNGAKGNAYGIEFLLRKDLTDRWYGWASLSLAKSDRTKIATGETVQFEHDKPILFNLVANRRLGDYWLLGFRWTYQSGGRYTPIVDLVPSSTNPSVLEPVYGQLNSQQYPDYHRLDLRAEYTRPKNWGYWKFYVDILNAYGRKNVTGYEYAPDGKKLISPPPGYGKHVPVTQKTSDDFFPSIGLEFRF